MTNYREKLKLLKRAAKDSISQSNVFSSDKLIAVAELPYRKLDT